jgi:hypothetical protein
MRVQLTNAGAALLNANTGPIQVSSYKLGSAFGYVPAPTDTDIHGTLVYTGAPSQYFVVNSNVVKYSVVLDYSLGPFNFGEIGLYTSTGVLFALATGDSLLSKIPVTSPGGNAVRADIYLSMVNQNYEMWLDYPDSSNEFRLAVLQSVDQLPPVSNATPNAYIVSGAVLSSNEGQQSSFLAYTDQSGLWNFDAYAFANQKEATIVAADGMSVTINNADYTSAIAASYYGELICQFSTGANYSICRYVQAVVEGSSQTVISFYNQLLQVPIVGDKIIFFSRIPLSTTIENLPIASSTVLGAIKVGTSLTIASDGTLNVASTAYPVTSVNGMTGDVEVTASDIPGLATVATTGKYSDLIGAPGQYILPIATTTVLGGVKSPTDGNLTIASDGTIDIGFSPVKTVNTIAPDASGNVTIPPAVVIGLVNPTAIPASTDFNSLQTAGLYFGLDANAAGYLNAPNTTAGGTLDVEPFTTTATGGDVIQRYTQSTGIFIRRYAKSTNTWSTWVQMATVTAPPVATTSSLGVVQIGAGLNVTGGGVLSTVIQSVNSKTSTNVVLTATDVGAIPVTSINIQGGVAGLDTTPNTPALATDVYTYGRMKFFDNTLGTLWDAGTWDASANHVAQTGAASSTPDVNTALLANGQQTIDMSYGGTNPRVVANPTYGTVSAEGMVYVVVTAGTTTLDGISTWNVGDLAVVIQGKWRRIANGGVAGAFSYFKAQQTTGFTLTAANVNWAYQWYGATGSGTLPTAASVPFAASILIYNQGTGTLTMNAASGDTLNVNSVASITIPPNTFAWFISRQSNEWDAFGTYAGVATTTQLAASKYYDPQGGSAGAITASQLVMQHVAVRTLTFAANFVGSQGYAGVAPTASATFNVAVNGTAVGTIVFAASSQTATFTTSGAVTVTPGQVMTVTAPASADATLANVSFTLLALAT